MEDSVEYLGFVIDRHGRHISRDKTNALIEMPFSTDFSQLPPFLRMIDQNSKFLPKLFAKFAVFHEFLKNDAQWEGGAECQNTFEAIKNDLAEASHLVHFILKTAICLADDASHLGIGAVLCHRLFDGTEKPVEHASKTSPAERNYGQNVEKAIALVLGVEKFH